MSAIRRVGRPTTIICKMRVPLSATPSPAWSAAFQTAARAASGAAGLSVSVIGNDVVFACDAEHVAQVVDDIDEAIAAANARAEVAGPASFHRGVHAGHRDLTWEERRAVSAAARRADVMKDY